MVEGEELLREVHQEEEEGEIMFTKEDSDESFIYTFFLIKLIYLLSVYSLLNYK